MGEVDSRGSGAVEISIKNILLSLPSFQCSFQTFALPPVTTIRKTLLVVWQFFSTLKTPTRSCSGALPSGTNAVNSSRAREDLDFSPKDTGGAVLSE